MFKFTVDEAKRYKNATDAVVNLIDEGLLEVGSEGLSLRAMDPSQIAMVCFTMPKTAFAEYSAPVPSAKIGLNFENISKILSRARGDEKLEISHDSNKLSIRFVAQDRRRNFKMPVLEIPAGPAKEPKIQHDAMIKLNGAHFKESLRDAALVGSHITLDAAENKFSIEVHGDSSDLVEENEKGGAGIIELKVDKPSRATFPLQYLEDIVKACPDNSPLTIYLKTNAPMKVDYEVETAKVTYYLAPRIENE